MLNNTSDATSYIRARQSPYHKSKLQSDRRVSKTYPKRVTEIQLQTCEYNCSSY